MLHQRDQTFLKAMVSKARANKRTTVPVGTRGTNSEGIALHRTKYKRKTNALTSSGDSSEPATRRPPPSARSVPLPANPSRATGQQATSGGRHLVSPEGGATYAAVAAATVAPQQPSGLLMPTPKGSNPFEPAVSQVTAPGRMSSDMSRPMSGMPVGTTKSAQMINANLPAGDRINKAPIFRSGVDDTRASLAWLRVSCPSNLKA
jgi:hypothetical protein